MWQHWWSAWYTQTIISRCELERACRN